jgi:hypothetical protein
VTLTPGAFGSNGLSPLGGVPGRRLLPLLVLFFNDGDFFGLMYFDRPLLERMSRNCCVGGPATFDSDTLALQRYVSLNRRLNDIASNAGCSPVNDALTRFSSASGITSSALVAADVPDDLP